MTQTNVNEPRRGASGQPGAHAAGAVVVEKPGAGRTRSEHPTARCLVTYKKRKKRKYSRGLKDIEKLELGLTDATRRLGHAIDGGLSTYQKSQKKSSRKKRDGAIKDALENWSKGLGIFLRQASDAPYDVTRTVNTKRLTRNFRKIVRVFTPPMFR